MAKDKGSEAVIMISLKLPLEIDNDIQLARHKLGGISRSAFIRQCVQEKLNRLKIT